MNFRSDQIFLPFNKEPFSQLGFLRGTNFKNIFIKPKFDKTKNTRISTTKATYRLDNFRTNSIRSIDKSHDWKLFEITASMAAIIASHHKEFKRLCFKNWLQNFLRELSYQTGQYSESVRDVVFDSNDEFLQNQADITIPLCAPSISSEWNQELGEYLVKSCGANIGVLYGDLDNQTRDFYIKKFGGENSVISGECKKYEKPLTPSIIKVIINKLSSYESQINLIIAHKLSVTSLMRNYNMNMNIFGLKKKNNSFALQRLDRNNDGSNKGFYIIDRTVL